ncbi:MAG: hypothetical protein ABIR32_09620 [Ilumatobacteraceae bacterium]
MTNDELLATACPLIGTLGAAFYFAPATLGRGGELGLDFAQFYVMGRGGVLGDVEPVTVWSAFGYFNPAMVEGAWTAGKAIIAPREAAREHFACAAAHGRAHYGSVDGIEAFVAAAEAVVAAADPCGLSLFAAYSAEPRADDAAGRAQQLLTVLREHRGSAHLIALRAAGVDSKTAHFVKRPNDVAMFGWSADDAPEITDATRTAMVEAERITDTIVAPAFAVLDDARRQALVTGLNGIAATAG